MKLFGDVGRATNSNCSDLGGDPEHDGIREFLTGIFATARLRGMGSFALAEVCDLRVLLGNECKCAYT